MKKLINWFRNFFFEEETITIPLTKDGVKTGQWVECKKGDDIYLKLIRIYGYPLPKQIEVVPYNNRNKNV